MSEAESFSVDLEEQGEGEGSSHESYEVDYDEQPQEEVGGDEQAEEGSEEEGRTSEQGSPRPTDVEAAGFGEEGFYEEDVMDEQQDSENEDAGPPNAASRAEQASASDRQAEADDSYSDDVEPEASPSMQDAVVEKTPVQQETAKYLQLLKSGQLKLPTLEKKEQMPGPAPKPPKPSSQHAQLSIQDMVSASVASNIFARSSKVLTPGPGAYEPAMDRFGSRSGCNTFSQQPKIATTKYSFGTARQRPRHVCIPHPVDSPGPMYLPQKQVSTLSQVPHLSFPRQEVGTRFMLSASMPANCPHWNPGPGHYRAQTIYTGGVIDPNDAPRYGFPKGTKALDSVTRLTTTSLLYESKGNAAVSPCSYNPGTSITKPSVTAYSLSEKAPSYFDAFLDPARQLSPGPVYSASQIDGRGKKAWGDEPRATFGRSKKEFEPELNLSATCFISKLHAHHSNQTLHSPGPVYFPELPQQSRAPLFASGPPDRFYDRFEPGRVV